MQILLYRHGLLDFDNALITLGLTYTAAYADFLIDFHFAVFADFDGILGAGILTGNALTATNALCSIGNGSPATGVESVLDFGRTVAAYMHTYAAARAAEAD